MSWQPIETAPSLQVVLVYFTNCVGNGRTVRACYFEAGTLEMDDDSPEDSDENDMNVEAGWFEDSESHAPCYWPLNGTPTHWMPLPDPPVVTP